MNFLVTLVSSTNKTDLRDITEILLKVVLSTIKPTIKLFYRIDRCFCLSEKKTWGNFRPNHTGPGGGRGRQDGGISNSFERTGFL
jgi:hypothetical protein